MAAGRSYPLNLVITAVDRITGPLSRIQAKLDATTAPFRKLSNALASISQAAGFPKVIAGLGAVGSALGGVGREVLRLGTRFLTLGTVGAFALGAIIRSSVKAGDELAKLADRLGLPINTVAELQFVADRAGIDKEVFDTSLEQFSRRLGQAKLGTGPLQAALKGTKLLPTLKVAPNTAVALERVFAAMAKIKDANIRASLAVAAFGRAGAVFANMANEDLPKLRAEFRRLAGDQEAWARQMEELDDQLDNFWASFRGLQASVMGALGPALSRLIGQLTEIFVTKRDVIKAWAESTGVAIAKFADELPARIDRLIAKFEEWRVKLQPIADMVGGWPNLFAAVAAAIIAGPLLGALATLTLAVVNLGLAAVTMGGRLAGALALSGLGGATGGASKVATGMSAAGAAAAGKTAGVAGKAGALGRSVGPVGLALVLDQVLGAILPEMKTEWTRTDVPATPDRSSAPSGISELMAKWGLTDRRLGPPVPLTPGPPVPLPRQPRPAGSSAATVDKELNARLEVIFNNAPKGMRLKPDPKSTLPMQLNTGMHMPEAR